jgi:hypothetical protein
MGALGRGRRGDRSCHRDVLECPEDSARHNQQNLLAVRPFELGKIIKRLD